MKICVIGLGSMGRRRIRLLRTMNKNITIVGVDNNRIRVENVAREFDIVCYLQFSDVHEKLDCAFVCTSPQSHASIIKECLESNLHVFSEINLINDLYDKNIHLAKQKGKILFLSSTSLYKEEIRIINKRVKQNAKICAYQYHIGQYLPDWHPWDNLKDFFVSNKNTNGCRELMAIEFPWIQYTFGKIKNVHAVNMTLTDLNLDFPDTYIIQVEHENRNKGSMIVDVVSRQAVKKLEVFNEDLYIEWGGTPSSLYEKNMKTGKMEKVQAGEYFQESGYCEFVNEYAYIEEIEEFFEVINGKNQYMVLRMIKKF